MERVTPCRTSVTTFMSWLGSRRVMSCRARSWVSDKVASSVEGPEAKETAGLSVSLASFRSFTTSLHRRTHTQRFSPRAQ